MFKKIFNYFQLSAHEILRQYTVLHLDGTVDSYPMNREEAETVALLFGGKVIEWKEEYL